MRNQDTRENLKDTTTRVISNNDATTTPSARFLTTLEK